MSSTVTFYIARHGKTMLNTFDKVQGWCDSFLTDEGIEVAQFLGKGLRGVEFESVYTSDLRRTSQTAQVVLKEQGQTELPITELFGFREAGFGTYESDHNKKMWTDIALYLHYKSLNDMFKAVAEGKVTPEMMLNAAHDIEPSGTAEDFKTVETRTQKALAEIAECESRKGKDLNVFIVAHGMSIIAMLQNMGGKELLQGHLDNVSISKVTYTDGKFTVHTMGDMSYVHKGRGLSHK